MNETKKLAKKLKDSDFAPHTIVPVSIVRSALFGVGLKGDDVVGEGRVIPADKRLPGVSITYWGPYLNQDHFRVWQACIYLARQAGALNGEKFVISSYADILRLCGRATGDYRQYRQTWKLLLDLTRANVMIDSARASDFLAGSLLASVGGSRKSGTVTIELNKTLAQFMHNETLSNDMLRLAGLGKDQIASWLHNYYASQKNPPNLTVSEIQKLSGTKLDLPRLRQRLKKAMEKLEGGIRPLVTYWELDPKTDILHVKKVATTVDMRAPDAVAAEKRRVAESRESDKARKKFKTQSEINKPRGMVVL